MSLTKRILLLFGILYPLMLLVLLAVIYRTIGGESRKDMIALFNSELRNEERDLQDLFAGIGADLETLALDPAVTLADDSRFTSYLAAEPETFTYNYSPEEKAIIDQFAVYRRTHAEVNSVYMGRMNGTFVRSHERAEATRYDPRLRPWFLAALSSPGRVVHTPPYASVTTSDVNIGSSLALINQDGQVYGVIGMDVTLNLLSRRLASRELPYGASYELWDRDSRVLVSTDESRLGKPGSLPLDDPEETFAPASLFESYAAACRDSLKVQGDYFTLAEPIEIPEGFLVTLIPRRELGRIIAGAMMSHAAGSTFILLAGCFAMLVMLNRYLLAPLRTMSAFLRSASRKGLPVPMHIRASGEISEFQDNYNAVVDLAEMESQELKKIKFMVITSLSSLAQKRDNETGLHILRTQKYMDILSSSYNQLFPDRAVDQARVTQMVLCAPLHDIGKVAIPDRILLKPSKLDPEEFEIMKRHTVYGKDAIEKAQVDLADRLFFDTAMAIVYSHHERWDGTGYPQGLSGADIPLEARFMAIADVYDALVTERVYKSAMSHELAVGIIAEGRETQFDPDAVTAFLASERMFHDVANLYGDSSETLDPAGLSGVQRLS